MVQAFPIPLHVQDWPIVNKAPKEFVKVIWFFGILLQKLLYALCIIYDGFDLASMSDHNISRIRLVLFREDSFNVPLCHGGYLANVEVVKDSSIGLSFSQDCQPRQARLGPFQGNFFK